MSAILASSRLMRPLQDEQLMSGRMPTGAETGSWRSHLARCHASPSARLGWRGENELGHIGQRRKVLWLA